MPRGEPRGEAVHLLFDLLADNRAALRALAVYREPGVTFPPTCPSAAGGQLSSAPARSSP